jgi:hypothetical protein
VALASLARRCPRGGSLSGGLHHAGEIERQLLGILDQVLIDGRRLVRLGARLARIAWRLGRLVHEDGDPCRRFVDTLA